MVIHFLQTHHYSGLRIILPNDKIIKFNNHLYTKINNNIIEIPNITNSSKMNVINGMYTLTCNSYTYDDDYTYSIRCPLFPKFSQTFSNVLFVAHSPIRMIGSVNVTQHKTSAEYATFIASDFPYNNNNVGLFSVDVDLGYGVSGVKTIDDTGALQNYKSYDGTSLILSSPLEMTCVTKKNKAREVFQSINVTITMQYIIISYVA